MLALGGCGAAYQATTALRTHRMRDSLKAGESITQVREKWGIPDITTYKGKNEEVWSYASRPNTNDVAAMVFYSGAKEGDTGRFLDLHFADGKLISWDEAKHTMPTKQGASFGFTVGSPNSGSASHF